MSTINDNLFSDSETSRFSSGWTTIVVWLIIGSTALFTGLILWEANSRNRIMTEAARTEDAVRRQMTASYRLLREKKPEKIIEADAFLAEKLAWLGQVNPRAYSSLKAARQFILAEALLLLGDENAYAEAEKILTNGIALLERSSGEIWQMGIFSRGKVRHKLGMDAQAIADLDGLITNNPSYGAAYYWRSLAKTSINDADGAAADAAHARALGAWPVAEQ